MNLRKTLATSISALVALLAFAALASAATIVDDDLGNVLFGTKAADTITANGGDDSVKALKGDDTVNAGGGNDKVFAGNGADTVDGGEGNDELRGGHGPDKQTGGAGNDTIFANLGRDESWGGEGNDTLWALARGDVKGKKDKLGDILHGEAGDDTFRTRDGEADVIDCGAGTDTAILDFKDTILDATAENKNGSCENVTRKGRAVKDNAEVVNP